MADLITPEFIPGMREAQKRKSATGTADFRAGKRWGNYMSSSSRYTTQQYNMLSYYTAVHFTPPG